MLGRDGNLIFLAADKTTSSGLVSGASVRKSQPVALAQTTAPQASAGKPATRVIETPDFQTNPTLARVIQALRESEERFRLLFATITDAILVFDVQSLQLVEFNEAALRLYGFSRDEMLRLSALDLSAEPEASWKTIERVIEEPQVIPLRLHRKKDGTVFPVEIAANGFDLQGRRMFCGVARDISERQQIQERLARLQRLKAILAAVQNAIIHQPRQRQLLARCCQVAVHEGGFKLAWIGRVARDGAVQPAAQAGATGYLEVCRPVIGDTPDGRGPVAIAIRENRPVIVNDTRQANAMGLWDEVTRKFGIGSVAAFPLHLGDRPVGSFQFYAAPPQFFDRDEISLLQQVCDEISFALTAMDAMAKRRQAKRELRTSERLMQDFFDSSPMGLLWINADGRILRANQAQQDLLQRQPEELLNRALADFFVEPVELTDLLARLAKGETLQNYHTRLRQADGNIAHALIDANGWWEKGRLVHSRWFVRDISRRVELEREVLKASDQERQRLGQDLHDDLCQQLTGISFLSASLARELAENRGDPAADARQIARLARNAASQAREIARGLSPIRPDADGLAEGLKALADRTAAIFRRQCRFDCPAPVRVPDPAVALHLFRIAQEAVHNAIKHSKARKIGIELVSQTDRVTLAVRDDGLGIPQKMTHQQGLGLRTMQYRIGLIGGSLAVQRRPDGGTEVVCTVRENPAPGESRKTA